MEKEEKIKTIRKILKKIDKTENKIRRVQKFATFDKRYTKIGALSDNCGELDKLKIKLFELNEEITKIENG